MFEWPPDWIFFFGIVAFLAASTAVRCWRELGILVALSALLIFPIKWIGAAAGFPALAADTLTWGPRGDKGWGVHMDPSPALLAAIILGSLAIIVWKRRAAKGQALAGQSGSIVMDIWKDAYANYLGKSVRCSGPEPSHLPLEQDRCQ